MRTPDALTQQLDALEHRLPELIAQYPDDADFWNAFAGEAELVEEQAGDRCHEVRRRIEAMLAPHGRTLAYVDLDCGD